eukprot:GHRR01030854.1.p2 GENE.GHRR01030854.1~~GHRR01030854.1.p2  ORF type:complete len:108 (-),score=25.06 GHRR01030854.1:413-736(-)
MSLLAKPTALINYYCNHADTAYTVMVVFAWVILGVPMLAQFVLCHTWWVSSIVIALPSVIATSEPSLDTDTAPLTLCCSLLLKGTSLPFGSIGCIIRQQLVKLHVAQ